METNPKKAKKAKVGETCTWTTHMDGVMIDAYLHQQNLGNKNGNSMTPSAMDTILKELKSHFPDKPLSKEKIKDHMKAIKTKFNVCYDIFKNSLSGFAWDHTRSMWIAEPEVWDKLTESKPEAKDWRNKSILFYDKLAQLYGKDRATGEDQDTASEMRGRRSSGGSSNNNNTDTIDEIDHLVETNEVTLEGFENIYADEELCTNNSPMRPTVTQSQNATSSRSKKRARKESNDEKEMNELAKIFQKVADAFEKSATEMIKQSKNASTEDIWEELVNIGVEPTSLPRVYMYLVEHQDALKAFKGVPIDKRKEMLPFIVQGYPFN